MERTVLNEAAKKHILQTGSVYGEVSDILGISPASLPRVVYSGDTRLTEFDVLKILKKSMGLKEDSELLTIETQDIKC